MSYSVCLSNFVKEYLPYKAVLHQFRKKDRVPAVVMKDIDGDGEAEIIAKYRWQEEDYIIVLKNLKNAWEIILNTRTMGQSAGYLLRSLRMSPVNLYPAPVRTAKGTIWGFINDRGDFIIMPKFQDAYDFQYNGLAAVSVNNLWGAINSRGIFVIAPKYQNIISFSEGRAAVVDDEGFKLIDEKGLELTRGAYSFIGTVNNGRALFSNTDSQGTYLYGYLGRQGEEVIPAKYLNASDFKNSKAVVKVKDNEYAMIGLNGEVLETYNYNYVGNLSDGLLAFQKEADGKYGFIDEKNNVIIEPQFQNVQPFREERAIINTIDDYIYKYGLIDKKGTIIIRPEFDNMSILGESRISVGKAMDASRPYMGYKYAVADTNGNFLTDFIYNDVSDYRGGLASAYDNNNTFFIDKSGKIAKELPIVSGGGSLTVTGEVIKAFVDNRITYFDKAGNTIYKENTIIPLNSQYKVLEQKYRPNKDYLVYYPQVEGIKNKIVQKKVNKKLEEMSGVKYINPDILLEASYSGDFSVEFFKKELLVLELNGYDFPFGAAHGMPTKVFPHINLVNGSFYELKNLFKQNSDYVKILSDIIGNQIKTDPQYEYVFPDTYKGIAPNQPFYLDENNLYIYFTPYEIAPYAAGFPTFKIAFKDIMNIINTEGEFWRAFN
jgi:hypothetical protein